MKALVCGCSCLTREDTAGDGLCDRCEGIASDATGGLLREGSPYKASARRRRVETRTVRFVRYEVADPGTRFIWNRYPSGIIGAAVVLGSTCYSLVWRKP